MPHKRKPYGPVLLVAAALTLSACGSDNGDDGSVTLRFAWWGNDTRHDLVEQTVALFEEKHPHITVDTEPADWDSYYDRLTTQVASQDTPDVFTIEIRSLGEFANNGVLAAASPDVDTTDLNENVLASGVVDGTQYAIPTGVNAFTVTANLAVLADAGVDLPDDSAWTWEDYLAVGSEVADATDSGTFGTQLNYNDAYLRVFAAQHGETLYGDSELAISEEVLTSWYQLHLDAIEQGASPDAALSTEVGSTGVETALVATNTGAFGMWWSNQLSAISTGSGSPIELLRMPQLPDAEVGGMFLQPNMFWATSSGTAQEEAAAELVDFLVNDPEAAEILGSDLGLPINDSVLEEVRDDMAEADVASLDFIDELAGELSDSPTAPPPGAGEIPDMLERYSEEVIFERMTPEEAAESLIADANATLG